MIDVNNKITASNNNNSQSVSYIDVVNEINPSRYVRENKDRRVAAPHNHNKKIKKFCPTFLQIAKL